MLVKACPPNSSGVYKLLHLERPRISRRDFGPQKDLRFEAIEPAAAEKQSGPSQSLLRVHGE